MITLWIVWLLSIFTVTTRGEDGHASFYGAGGMTAAHKSLPMGTRVRVTNKHNGRSVVVTIRDRGPFIKGRVIDMSGPAASALGMRESGVVPVRVEVLGR